MELRRVEIRISKMLRKRGLNAVVRHFLLGVTALCVARGAFAAMPYARVPAGHWSYVSVEKLESQGYDSGTPAGTFDGRRELTRFDFAAATERLYRGLRARMATATEPGTLHRDLAAFRELLVEFGGEVEELGFDVTEMRRQLRDLEARVTRLQRTAPPSPFATRPFGLERALSEERQALLSGLIPAPIAGGSSGAGPFELALRYRQAEDPRGRIPFSEPDAAGQLRATLRYPLGRYLLSAFYSSQGPRADRFGLLNPYAPLGHAEGFGGGISGGFGSRLTFELETARLLASTSDGAYVYFRGDLDYRLGDDFGLGIGYERGRFDGGTGIDTTSYTLGFYRRLGRYTRFNLIYRYFDVDGAFGARAGGTGDSGALGSITVRF